MLSVIIPTKNEEAYLPKLLSSLRNQSYRNFEVIVSDAGSKDGTIEIAKKFKCTTVIGRGKGSPSIQRNNGAKIAKGKALLFLDADVQIHQEFLKKLVNNIKKQELEAGSCFSKPYDGKFVDHFIVYMENILMNSVKRIWPHAYGFCIFCTSKSFKSVKGFDESIFLGEDNDFARRVAKKFRFGILKNPVVFASMRRWQNEGRIRLLIKYTFAQCYRLFFGEIKGSKFNYRFGYKK